MKQAIISDFVRKMRRRGAEKFWMPTHEMKTKVYDADAPQSIYELLPKKLRMKKTTVSGISDILDGQTAWLLESKI